MIARLRIAGSVVVGVLGSGLLLFWYARGTSPLLGFVALVPWLLTLERLGWRAALLSGVLMSMAFVAAVFSWFGIAVGNFTGIGGGLATASLIFLAPLMQPQFLAFATLRNAARRRYGAAIAGIAGASAWIACEWWWPKLLGDSLGHGLATATALRQIADLGGVAAITALLLITNDAAARSILAIRTWRSATAWATCAALVPMTMWAYGHWRLSQLQQAFAEPTPWIRIAMVQSNLVDYERQRETLGTYGVVRRVLDRHFELSRDAIEKNGAQALLWSETVYPTTFDQPRSTEGADFDAEIRRFVDSTGVPLLFGSYEVDTLGEYNSAVLLDATGIVGRYRKTHPFPLTEFVPGWLDGPRFRAAFPWAGSWRRGDGARVFPLRAPNGELQIAPLICLDDVHPELALDAARLGAQALISLSNDAWFSASSEGATLHLWVAIFRSIETRLPQLRVTTNGLTAFVDPSGEVLASAAIGDQAVLGGAVPIRNPPVTLMVRWGDWLGGAASLLLLALGAAAWWPQRRRYRPDLHGAVLPGVLRGGVVLLQCIALIGLLWLLAAMLRDGFQVYSLGQLQAYAWLVLAPLLAAHVIRAANTFQARIDGNTLLLQQRGQRIEIPLPAIATLQPWRWPAPGFGVTLRLSAGRTFPLEMRDPLALIAALNSAGISVTTRHCQLSLYAQQRAAARHRWLDHAIVKFALFPLLPALVAFRLHQVIAFGSVFGEYYTYGAWAYLTGLTIWWASWSLGMMLFAAALRCLCEAAAIATFLGARGHASSVRNALEVLQRLVYYMGIPCTMAARLILD